MKTRHVPAVCLFFSLLLGLGTLSWAGAHAHHAHAHHERAAKQGILLVAFGSTVSEARAAFTNVEEEVLKAFPGVPIRWAYTSRIVRQKLAEEGKVFHSPETALALMMEEGFTHVAVQSLHTIGGWEFHDLVRNVHAFSGMSGGFDRLVLGGPLLNSTEDIARVADVLVRGLPDTRKKGEAVVFMGHGTDHPANALYVALMVELEKRDPEVFLGTVEGSPGLQDVMDMMKEKGIRKAYLMPFMAVAGDHARNDLAGDDSESWKSLLTGAGIQCVPVLRGTAEMDAVVNIWIDHLKTAMDSL